MSDRFSFIPLTDEQWRELQPLMRAARAINGELVVHVLERPYPDHHARLTCYVLSQSATKKLAKILSDDAATLGAGRGHAAATEPGKSNREPAACNAGKQTR